jgi:hypothetical protein
MDMLWDNVNVEKIAASKVRPNKIQLMVKVHRGTI